MPEIELLEIEVERVGVPHGDGTGGSALYSVPLKLSERPSRQWSEIFVVVWDRPPECTTMHRPGIARVNGDRVILDGTTVEEVRDVHAKTLRLVLAETNRRATELAHEEEAQANWVIKARAAHEENVRAVAANIDFG